MHCVYSGYTAVQLERGNLKQAQENLKRTTLSAPYWTGARKGSTSANSLLGVKPLPPSMPNLEVRASESPAGV